MHFRAARRPFISWGDSSSTHACAVAMRAFFYFEKSWLHLYYLAGGGIVSGPVQTWRKKNISFIIFYTFLSCHLFNLSKKISKEQTKKFKVLHETVFKPARPRIFLLVISITRQSLLLMSEQRKKKLASIILNWKV